MKALTLHQPWASLIAAGHKKVETRSWGTGHRGRVAIHAGKRKLDYGDELLLRDLEVAYGVALPAPLPFGAVVAVATLIACVPMTRELIGAQTPLERLVGGWGLGRYAWVLEDIEPLVAAVPARGAQGLWEWTP